VLVNIKVDLNIPIANIDIFILRTNEVLTLTTRIELTSDMSPFLIN